jgi:hypothetical protein
VTLAEWYTVSEAPSHSGHARLEHRRCFYDDDTGRRSAGVAKGQQEMRHSSPTPVGLFPIFVGNGWSAGRFLAVRLIVYVDKAGLLFRLCRISRIALRNGRHMVPSLSAEPKNLAVIAKRVHLTGIGSDLNDLPCHATLPRGPWLNSARNKYAHAFIPGRGSLQSSSAASPASGPITAKTVPRHDMALVSGSASARFERPTRYNRVLIWMPDQGVIDLFQQ